MIFFFFRSGIFYSTTAAELSEGLMAISIEDSECPVQKPTAPEESQKHNEQLLPNKMCYEWKDITQEFFESVKGKFCAKSCNRCVLPLDACILLDFFF